MGNVVDVCGMVVVVRVLQTQMPAFTVHPIITKARTGITGGVLDSDKKRFTDKKAPGEPPKIRTEIQM
jgi:hypothetical protein